MALLRHFLSSIILNYTFSYLLEFGVYCFEVPDHKLHVEKEVLHDCGYLLLGLVGLSHEEVSVEVVVAPEELVDFPGRLVLIRAHLLEDLQLLSVGFQTKFPVGSEPWVFLLAGVPDDHTSKWC